MVGVTGLLRHLGSSLCDRHTPVCLSPAVRTYFPAGSNPEHHKILNNNAPDLGALLFNLVGVTGFEPTTSATRTQRSTRLSYTPITGRLCTCFL